MVTRAMTSAGLFRGRRKPRLPLSTWPRAIAVDSINTLSSQAFIACTVITFHMRAGGSRRRADAVTHIIDDAKGPIDSCVIDFCLHAFRHPRTLARS